jgi:hypothetical protein
MTRHLQRPYRIWPLIDQEEENANARTTEFSSFNLASSLSTSTCDNPQPTSVQINEGSAKATAPQVEAAPLDEAHFNAVAQVLNTTELLELILSHLPPTSLYLSRNACTHWFSLIATSPSLKSSLWFHSPTPAKLPNIDYVPRRSSPQFELNPILQDLNIFQSRHTEWDDCNRRHWFASITFPPRWLTRNAYWREMQITEPPIKRVFLRSSWLDKYVECETGVTAGMLSDLLEFQVGRLYYFHS